MRLCEKTISQLPSNVQKPGYERSKVTGSIVHLGIGAFHRAHQAMFTDAVLASGDLSWGIIGAGIISAEMKDALKPQDCLYALAERDADSEKIKVIGSIVDLFGGVEDAAKLLRKLGQGKRIDELVTTINRAAEAAVPMGKDLLVSAVQDMSVTDARKILTGGDTSVTEFFAEKTRLPLGERFLPVVTQATEQVGLTQKYNAFASKASSFGLMSKEDANLSQYVTGKTLDGLYRMIGEEEKKIRQNPLGSGSAIVQKVFGALR